MLLADNPAKGGMSRAASIQTTQSPKRKHLNKAIDLQYYITDETGNWTGEPLEWK
jgi:hypothetical protein